MNQENEQFITSWMAEIKRLSAILEKENAAYRDRFLAARLEHERRTAQPRIDLEAATTHLIAYLKKHKLDIFPGKTDRVVVTGGVILRQIAAVVRKARHITPAFLRLMGLGDEGIRVEESVNWQEIEAWSDDQLARIGTKRKNNETFAYELTEVT